MSSLAVSQELLADPSSSTPHIPCHLGASICLHHPSPTWPLRAPCPTSRPRSKGLLWLGQTHQKNLSTSRSIYLNRQSLPSSTGIRAWITGNGVCNRGLGVGGPLRILRLASGLHGQLTSPVALPKPDVPISTLM